MTRKRPRVSQSRPRQNGTGPGSNGGTSPDQPGSIEQMLEILTGQIAELQRMAAIAASDTTRSIRNTARRSSVRRS